jgi:hypothetical protein
MRKAAHNVASDQSWDRAAREFLALLETDSLAAAVPEKISTAAVSRAQAISETRSVSR